jgi:hypothetical protein
LKTIVLTLLTLLPLSLLAQNITVQGKVYDFFSKQPLEAVTIQTSSKRYAITDSFGRYTITLEPKDQFWFSYLGKNTMRYLADTVTLFDNFDVALYVDAAWLPNVTVRNRSYRQDSIANRKEYAKVFNYKKPGISTSTAPPSTYVPGAVTAGIDLEEFINMFRFKRNRQLEMFQRRLIEEEQEKYVKKRYTKRMVKEVTGLKDGEALDTFMVKYTPSYELLTQMNDIELGYYVQQCYKSYLQLRRRKR